MTQPNPGEEARLNLIRVNRSSIYVMLCRVAAKGNPVADLVAFVADTSDKIGVELAQAACEKSAFEMMQQEEALGPNLEQIPTAIILVTLEDAKAILSQSHPNVVVGLERQPAQGYVRVISISAGAAILVHSDVRATTRIAEA